MTLAAPLALAPSYLHLFRMTTARGLFEHASHDTPLDGHGYCVDDVARALVVTLREPDQTAELGRLAELYLAFLEEAVTADGRVHNRMDHEGRWSDEARIGDWWGRAVGALGFAASHAQEPSVRTRAMDAFLRAATRRSPDVRASCFAALGAAEVLRVHPDAGAARGLLIGALAAIPVAPGRAWAWPEPRLRYANAALCEALIAGGAVLDRPGTLGRGLELLAFLLETETGASGRLSVTGSAGRSPGETGPLWDQQAIEPAAIADACARAYEVTGEARWLDGVRLAWAWFLGDNDSGIAMIDSSTGAGYDGLEPGGRNENRGAESTLAALGTMQRARALGLLSTA